MKKEKTEKVLVTVSAVLGIVALILILISVFGDFKTNWVLAAGLFWVAGGGVCNIIHLLKGRNGKR